MALKLPVPIPTPVGVVLKPPSKSEPSAYVAPTDSATSYPTSTAPSDPGQPSTVDSSASEIVNPWEAALKANYEASQARPYSAEWQSAVNQASALGGRDYEGDLRRFAAEDVQKQITSADNQLGAIGMRELALRPDVQADRAKARSDADTRAMIDSQGIKESALSTMTSVVSAATGAELDRIAQMVTTASAGANNYIDFETFATGLEQSAADREQAAKDAIAADDAARASTVQADNETRAAAESKAAQERAAAKAAVRKGFF